MQEQIAHSNGLRDMVVILAGMVIIFAGMRYAQDLIVPLLLSMFIAVIASVPVEWLKNRGLSLVPAVILVMLGFIVLEILFAVLLGSTVEQFSQSLPGYQSRLHEMTSVLISWFARHGIDVSESGIENVLDPGAVMGFANTLIHSIGSLLSNVMLIMFTVLFMLLEAWNLPDKFNAMNSERSNSFLTTVSGVIQSTKQYTYIKTLMSLITGTLIWAGLVAVGLDFAVLWGFLAFLLNFIPTVGSIIAAVPAVLLGLVQLGPMSALIVILIFLAINTLIGNLIEPKFMGQKVGLSTLVVFLSMVFWGWLLGTVGMLLSVPLTMLVKFAAMSSEQTHWLSILLGSSVPVEDSTSLPDPEKKIEQISP